MKIGIITYDEYINIPYIKKYENILKESNIYYDIILWNRSNIQQTDEINHLVFNKSVSKSKWSKVIPFILWRNFTLKILKQKEYDKLIILTTIPGILIGDYIVKKYKNKYLLDIRDFTYENFQIYKNIVEQLIKKSYITTLSSKGFYRWLRKNDKLVLTHNITNYENSYNFSPLFRNGRIIIAFVGGIRYYNENINIINQLRTNDKFLLKYIGKVHPKCDLKPYCDNNGIKNVEFYPSYNNAEKPEIYKDIDLINAIYGNKTLEVSTALPNKLYDCIIFKKPIIVSKDTYLAEVVTKYNLGITIDIYNESLEEIIFNYVRSFNEKQFIDGCNRLLELVISEENDAIKKIKMFIN